MQAVIIAAGESSRFWPLNKSHKAKIRILGKSLIYWTVKNLAEKGIKDVVLVIKKDEGFKEEILKETKGLAITISFVVQEQVLGTGNAVFCAKEFIKEPFFIVWPYKVMASEIMEDILKLVEKEKPEAVLVGAETNTPSEYGILKMENNKVTEIVENPEKGKEPSNIRLLGTCYLEPDFFDYYQKIKNHHQEDFIDALNLYIKEKRTGLIVLDKEALTLKYPWDLFGVFDFLINSKEFHNYISPTAKIGKNVIIGENIYIGENTIVGENTVVSDKCFIGDNCKIGANNVLRGPLNLEAEVITGAFSEIKHCIVQQGTHFHSGYFGDSIIGENCRFGAGFVTANRKIDRQNIKSTVKNEKIDTNLTYFGTVIGKNTRFGIQAGTMPGVMIGADCTVGPGTLVFENLQDKEKLFTEFKTVNKK